MPRPIVRNQVRLTTFDDAVQFAAECVRPIVRNQVRLTTGPARQTQDRNAAYLLSLPADRLLHNFRVNAGLASTAKPLGGWENPACGLRGHFTGHFLSACAATFAGTGDERFAERVDDLLNGLRQCQDALGGGYLSAFPQSDFDTLETKFGGVWAPYYTLHKILAGLIDAHVDAGRSQALPMASAFGDWVAGRLSRLSPETLEGMLRTDGINPSNEYGGIGVALYDLHALTGRPGHLAAARAFDRDWFLGPLIDGEDRLAGLHANTHLPQGLAAAKRYERTGDHRYRRAAETLWRRTALHRSYVSGGSSGPRPDGRERSEGGEHWPEPDRLAKTLTPKISESCVTHNMVRLTDAIAAWSDDPAYADFRERAFLNSVLPTQHPVSPGAYLYSHPLGAGSRKVYGDAEGTFWCCYGTGVEAFAHLGDGIYAEEGDALHVRQFVPSELAWAARRVRLVQDTGFPYEPATRLMVHVAEPTDFTLRVRVPGWAQGPTCLVNGAPVTADVGRPIVLRRTWADGDRVELRTPMTLRTEMLPGDPTHHAFVYGPVVLAARTPHAPELGVSGRDAVALVRPTDAPKLHFAIPLVSGHVVPLVPLLEITDEAYGVYFKTPG